MEEQMKSVLRIVFSTFLLTSVITACVGSPTTSPDMVGTAVAQTQAWAQATDNANSLTAAAAQPSPIPPIILPPLLPTPTEEPPIDPINFDEAELMALVVQAITGLADAADETTNVVNVTTNDNMLTAQEIASLYNQYNNINYRVQRARRYVPYYVARYGGIAPGTKIILDGVDVTVGDITDSNVQISVMLDAFNNIFKNGGKLQQGDFDHLLQQALRSQNGARGLRSQTQNLLSALQQDQQGRLEDIARIQPDNIPGNNADALRSAFEYLDQADLVAANGNLQRNDLLNLARRGKNAQAGLQFFLGTPIPNLPQYNGNLNDITDLMAHGKVKDMRNKIKKSRGDLNMLLLLLATPTPIR
jgi:hypothetical protein